ITPLSALPTITDPVIIDGFTQPGSSANTLTVGDDSVHLIELDGTNAPGAAFVVNSGGNTFEGLVINRFPGASFNPGYAFRRLSDVGPVRHPDSYEKQCHWRHHSPGAERHVLQRRFRSQSQRE